MLRYISMVNSNLKNEIPLKIIIYSSVFFVFILAVFALIFFLNLGPISLLLGWIFGFAISIFNFLLIILQANRLKTAIKFGAQPSLGRGYLFFRLGLFSLGFIISATFKIDGQELFNIFSVFFGYISISLIIFLFGGYMPLKMKKI